MEEVKDIRDIQMISLKILEYVDKICRENNLKYSLVGGTLIGAIRHKGFIPWDDDVDIMMPRPDYEKFLEIMDKTESKKYKALYFSDKYPNYTYPFIKVVDLDTELYEKDFLRNEHMGVFIDIFPADGYDEKKSRKTIKKVHNLRAMCALSISKGNLKKPNQFLKNTLKFFLSFIAKPLGYKFWLKKIDKQVKKCKYEDYDLSASYSGSYMYKEIFKKSLYDEMIEVPFENKKFYAFKNYDEYLRNIYGDYMTPPPENKRNPHHGLKIYKK